jgi:ribosomal protein S18 acetylase RimI-like enzyme
VKIQTTQLIRHAQLSDADQLAIVRTRTWQTAYRGLMPDEILDNFILEEETTRWQSIISSLLPDRFIFCACPDEEIVGFCSGGKNRDQDPVFDCEIFALYVLPKAQKTGLGKALLENGCAFLAERGYKKMIIWTLSENQPARNFYTGMGGHLVRKREIDIRGSALLEVGYGWSLS